MSLNRLWRVDFQYVDATGNVLQGYAPQSADVTAAPVVGPDGSMSADPVALMLVIGANFATPAGGTISVMGIATSQAPIFYSLV